MFLASSSNGQEPWSRAQDEYLIILSCWTWFSILLPLGILSQAQDDYLAVIYKLNSRIFFSYFSGVGARIYPIRTELSADTRISFETFWELLVNRRISWYACFALIVDNSYVSGRGNTILSRGCKGSKSFNDKLMKEKFAFFVADIFQAHKTFAEFLKKGYKRKQIFLPIFMHNHATFGIFLIK